MSTHTPTLAGSSGHRVLVHTYSQSPHAQSVTHIHTHHIHMPEHTHAHTHKINLPPPPVRTAKAISRGGFFKSEIHTLVLSSPRPSLRLGRTMEGGGGRMGRDLEAGDLLQARFI